MTSVAHEACDSYGLMPFNRLATRAAAAAATGTGAPLSSRNAVWLTGISAVVSPDSRACGYD